MNDSDKKEFATFFVAMGENFNATISKEGLKIRFEALREFSIEQVKQACISLIKNRVYPGMPTTGEIRAAMDIPKPPEIGEQAQLRLTEIMNKIREVGSYGSPKWDDPIVSDLLTRRWSWQSLCAMTETEHKWWAKEFIEAYRAAAGNYNPQLQIESERLKSLAGGIGQLKLIKGMK